MREKILAAAVQIVKSEGVERLSIRKLAEKIEYSPAIIYHYFTDKEDILDHILAERYQQFLEQLLSAKRQTGTPMEQLLQGMRRYMTVACEMENVYVTLMRSQSPSVLARTSVLRPGTATSKPAIGLLCSALLSATKNRVQLDSTQLELTAQILWAAMYGLVTRIHTEHIDGGQRERLIGHFLTIVECTVNAL